LNDALANNYDEVRQLFEYSFNADSDKVLLSARTNNTTLTDFRLDIDLSRTGDEIRVKNPTTGALLFEMDFEEIGSTGTYRLTGRADTSLEGLTLLYTGDGTDTIDVEASQGYGDRLYNMLTAALDETDGSLAGELEYINDTNDNLDTEITDLESTIEDYRLQLLEQFSSLETAIARVNSLLTFLDAQAQSLYGNSN
jgi:flagellar hook-associated protein 2